MLVSFATRSSNQVTALYLLLAWFLWHPPHTRPAPASPSQCGTVSPDGSCVCATHGRAARDSGATPDRVSRLDRPRLRHDGAPAAELVTWLDTGRAERENRIKALTDDRSLDTFCPESFDSTDAAVRPGCVLDTPPGGLSGDGAPDILVGAAAPGRAGLGLSGRREADSPKPGSPNTVRGAPPGATGVFPASTRPCEGLPLAAQRAIPPQEASKRPSRSCGGWLRRRGTPHRR